MRRVKDREVEGGRDKERERKRKRERDKIAAKHRLLVTVFFVCNTTIL